ncbi:restriction endonuclease subunit S [Vibrio cholerae]
MTVENNVPEIRFKGFSGEWQDKEIGSILAETKRPIELLDNELYQLVTVKRRNEGVVPRASLKGKNILVKNYYGIKAGDYLISKRQVVHGANGIVPESLDNAVVSNEYLVLTDSDEITSKFWTVISKRPEMHKLFFISSYGVDIEKLVFDVSDWKNRSIAIPDVAEQNAITTHFQKLDSLINQHQQKHAKLSNIKKAMLEKMFPKQGETIPEIRFKGFGGEWKTSQLSELALFNPKEELPMTFKYVDLESVKGTSLLGYREELKESAPSRAQRLAKKGDVFFQTVRPYQKNNYLFNMEESDFVFSTGYAQLRPYYDSNFLLNLIQRDSFVKDVLDNCTGTSYPAVNASILASLEVIYPEIKEEQAAIGNYFQKLDTLINQHQQQITKLNNIKQACLSKMFV